MNKPWITSTFSSFQGNYLIGRKEIQSHWESKDWACRTPNLSDVTNPPYTQSFRVSFPDFSLWVPCLPGASWGVRHWYQTSALPRRPPSHSHPMSSPILSDLHWHIAATSGERGGSAFRVTHVLSVCLLFLGRFGGRFLPSAFNLGIGKSSWIKSESLLHQSFSPLLLKVSSLPSQVP